jgi:hypothetical protein
MSNNVNDSVSTSEGGIKFDGDKVRWDLMPWDALEEIAKVLTVGAKKYTIQYKTEWDRLLDAKDVVEIRISTQKENVVVVTKNNSGKVILNSAKNKDRIAEIGKNATQTKLNIMPSVGDLIQNLVQEIDEQNGSTILKSTNLLKSNTTNIVTKVVKFAERLSTCILTIVTRQGNLEVYFVPNATTGLDSWETIWRDLCAQLNISKPMDITGERNWEKGMEYGRLIRATIGHVTDWAMRRDVDSETGLSHLAHAGCCILFLLAYVLRNIGKDNRPLNKEIKYEHTEYKVNTNLRWGPGEPRVFQGNFPADFKDLHSEV